MKITKSGHVYQLAFMPRLFPVNCYFVEEESSLTLIDAAMPYSAKAILAAAKAIGKPITHILLTHAHDDHVGALDALKQALPAARVGISRRDSRLLAGDRSLMPGEPDSSIRGGVPKGVRTVPNLLLEDGDRVGSLQVVMAPGHTPGSVAYYDHRSGALLAGDAFQTRGGMAVSGVLKPLFPFPAMATWHAGTALASARRLAALEPALLGVGHGRMIERPAAAIAQAIADADRAAERDAMQRRGGKGHIDA